MKEQIVITGRSQGKTLLTIKALEEKYAELLRENEQLKEQNEDLRAAVWLQSGHEYGNVFIIDDFIENVEDTGIMGYDGNGVFVDEEGKRGEILCDVAFLQAAKQRGEKFVLWFNK